MRTCLLLATLLLFACEDSKPADLLPDSGCIPLTCSSLGANCSRPSDGCGGLLECGTCTAPEICGGGGVPFTCGDPHVCVEDETTFCKRLGKNCGLVTATNSCGVEQTSGCGECTPPEVCNPDNTCGACVTETDQAFCARLGRQCGALTALDNCGVERTVDCGTCTGVELCGGGGAPGVCGCLAETAQKLCAERGKDCGVITVTDACNKERTVGCGFCAAPDTCDGNVCACVPKTCAQLGRSCGKAPDGCGHEIDCGECSGGATPPPFCIRIAAANITSGNKQSYDPGEGIRIFQGLKPDIVLIQEFNYGNNFDDSIRSMVATAFGPDFWHYREGGSPIPNGVISRFPIVESGEWNDSLAPNRDYAWARIDIPGPKDLWAVSLHLLTGTAGDRASEASQVVTQVTTKVPVGDYLVVGGDLNTSSRTESSIKTLAQIVSTAPPYPVDHKGNPNTSAKRTEPLDWVLVNSVLRAHEAPVAFASRAFGTGLVFDSRIYTPLSDVAPVLRTDSAATNMQHMAVVREFCVPVQ